MYCCVMIACPLVCHVIRRSSVRLLLYFLVAAAQQFAAALLPALQGKPWMFLVYPLFFELGILACAQNWTDKLKEKFLLPVLYCALLVLLACAVPTVFSFPGVNCLFDFFGVIAAYVVCLSVKKCRLLHRMAACSYPVFLLHEPLIGRCTGALLRKMGVSNGAIYILLWFAVVLTVTLTVIWILKKTGLNKVLWEFEIGEKR
jgi:peptidoglycan/LPS O-acetylase OafA/YrhL